MWPNLRDIFCEDDGSLPEIVFRGLGVVQVSKAYQFLLSLSETFHGGSNYWSNVEKRDFEVTSKDTVEGVFAAADCADFHVVLEVRSPSGIEIPTLGVSIDADSLAIDYRMGPEWSPDAVNGLLEIIGSVGEMTACPSVAHVFNSNDPSGSRLLALFGAGSRAGALKK